MANPTYDFYSVDASVMIKLKDMLPYDLFKQAWDEIARLISKDCWKIFDSVADEIHGEAIKKWLSDNGQAIVKFNPRINEYINVLMADLQKKNLMMIDPMSLKSNADPFVVMLALYLEERDLSDLRQKTNDTTCCVLTNEVPKPNKINIPVVCDHYGIPYKSLFDFMRHHGWRITVNVQNP